MNDRPKIDIETTEAGRPLRCWYTPPESDGPPVNLWATNIQINLKPLEPATVTVVLRGVVTVRPESRTVSSDAS